MKLPYTPARFTLLPYPSFPCSRLEGWRGGGVDGRLWPPPPGGARFYFASLLLWDPLAPAKVRDQSASVRRGAQLRKSLPRQRSNSSDDKLAARSKVRSSRERAAFGRGKPPSLPLAKGVPGPSSRASRPGDFSQVTPPPRAPRRRGASLTCALAGEPMLEKESAGEW